MCRDGCLFKQTSWNEEKYQLQIKSETVSDQINILEKMEHNQAPYENYFESNLIVIIN